MKKTFSFCDVCGEQMDEADFVRSSDITTDIMVTGLADQNGFVVKRSKPFYVEIRHTTSSFWGEGSPISVKAGSDICNRDWLKVLEAITENAKVSDRLRETHEAIR